MAKIFAKFAKMFVEFLVKNVAIRRRPTLVLHLVEKYAKMKSTRRTKKRAPRLQKVKLDKKVNVQ